MISGSYTPFLVAICGKKKTHPQKTPVATGRTQTLNVPQQNKKFRTGGLLYLPLGLILNDEIVKPNY